MKISIPISVGELLDKITILQIKVKNTESSHVREELDHLISIAKHHEVYEKKYLDDLLKVNKKLWEIEDCLRESERSQKFDDEFISLARGVYVNNDERYEIKRKINEETSSYYREIKIHK